VMPAMTPIFPVIDRNDRVVETDIGEGQGPPPDWWPVRGLDQSGAITQPKTA
jgi:hypothetical protein